MYRDKATAQQAADSSFATRDMELWVYRCQYCSCWHLTSKDPQARELTGRDIAHRPAQKHSRKRGFKPRNR